MRLDVVRYAVPPRGARLDEVRRGLLLRLTVEEVQAYSELAPLQEPGFSKESLVEVETALTSLPLSMPSAGAALDEVVAEVVPASLPSLRWALEVLYSDLLARRAGLPLAEWWGASRHKNEVELNALLPLSADEQMLQEALARGFKSFKMKASAGAGEQIETLLLTLKYTAPEVRAVRLDANRGLTVEQAEELLRRCRHAAEIEYIEEPLAGTSIEEYRRMQASVELPIALDETLWLNPGLAQELLAEEIAQVVVLKPCMLGGYYVCRALLSTLPQKVKCVCTSSMELGPAYVAGVHAALALGAQRRMLPCGFDTLAPYEECFVPPELRPTEGRIRVPEAPGLGYTLSESLPWERLR